MRPIHAAAALVLSCPLSAAAQVHQVAFEVQTPGLTELAIAIDNSVAASAGRVVVATNWRLQVFSTGGQPLDDRAVDGSNFPFEPVDTAEAFPFFDPRVEYDPIHDRFWLMYSEKEPGSYVHIAISEGPAPDGFAPAGTVDPGKGWHFFTGAGANPAFDFQHPSISEPLQFTRRVEHATINVTEHHLNLLGQDIGANPVHDKIVAFPLSHAGGSMLSGARPSEGDLRILNMLAVAPLGDDGFMHYAVQSPHEVIDDIQLFLVTPKPPQKGSADPTSQYDGVQDAVRLGGRWFDALGVLQYKWVDLPMPSEAFHYFNPGVSNFWPATPDQSDPSWEIVTRWSKFDSGMLARTVNNELRLFAAQQVLVADGAPLAPVDRHELRYYVIDPDLDNFFTSWTPSIEVAGAAPAAQGEETYHGNIAVNADGIAYITFTRSGPAQWPSLYYSKLTTDYTATVFTTQIQQGPPQRFMSSSLLSATPLSSDYTDLQPAPDGCGFWSLAALVAFADAEPEPPDFSNLRNIWLTEISACNTNAEMNGDGTVDEFDLALYLDHYARGAPQADMNGDKSVDLTDYVIYSDEYAKR